MMTPANVMGSVDSDIGFASAAVFVLLVLILLIRVLMI